MIKLKTGNYYFFAIGGKNMVQTNIWNSYFDKVHVKIKENKSTNKM